MRLTPLLSLAILAATGCAQSASNDPCLTAQATCPASISTHATAQTRVPSTAADISVSITVSDRSMAAVQRQMGDKSQALLGWLRAQNVTRLVTDGISFTPQTRYVKSGPDRTVGYDGTITVSFRTTPEKSPEILTGVLDHGANNIVSTNFTPTEEDIDAARQRLSAEATKSAVAQGEAIAKAAGLHVAVVRSVVVESSNEIPSPISTMYERDAVAAPRKVAPPIATAAGEEAMSVRVDVVVAALR